MFVGMDFGTTNSAVGLVDGAGNARIVSHSRPDGAAETIRSMLAFDRAHRDDEGKLAPLVGHDAIAA
ncbi:MAG: Hsp70 family protein, partial [Magnetospirillum sp.]|nr:Hsp70 family protein [Magnetospirillum sp.]